MDRPTPWRTALIGLPLLMIVTGFGYYLTHDSEEVARAPTGPIVDSDRPEQDSGISETSRPKARHEEFTHQSGQREIARDRSPDPPERRRRPRDRKPPVQTRKPKRAA